MHSERAMHLITSPQKVLDRPKQYIEADKPNNPVKMTGFRPMWSENRLQCNTVRACVAKNKECCDMKKLTLKPRMGRRLMTHQQSYIISNLSFVAIRDANVPYQLEKKAIWMRGCETVGNWDTPEGQTVR